MTEVQVQLLPPDDGAKPWLREAEVPVRLGDVEVGRARVFPQDGALMAKITFTPDFVGPASEYHVYGNIVRDSFHKDVRTVEEVAIIAVGVTR